MVRISFGRLGTLSILLVACGTEPPPPGVLTITFDHVPGLVREDAVAVAGTVTRDPVVADVPIVTRIVAGTFEQEDTLGWTDASRRRSPSCPMPRPRSS